MNTHVVCAVFRRNFSAYFSNPTGYLFICVFVLLSALAAFWPPAFFNNNLASLHQLNEWFPYIMLVFIPAITMSIWSEERRLGTDELMLTLPATDLDVVVGKYLAAVAIFSVSLVYAVVVNALLLTLALGRPDFMVLVSTLFGYWLIGLAMLAIGMAGSFLTNNLTVAFVLGVALNAPLVWADDLSRMVLGGDIVALRQFTLAEQFSSFGRGVVSLSAMVYFVGLAVAAIYVSIVLIGRRHWTGVNGGGMLGHYLVRAVALVLIVLGLNALASRFDLRTDVSSAGSSSLTPQTRTLIANLESDRAIQIDAFVSPTVPETFVQTRLQLLSMLEELKSRGGSKLNVNIHNTVPNSPEADRAEKQFGIAARPIPNRTGGRIARDDVFLGVAFTRGLDKVVVPFVDRGIPIQYELIRSISTVGQKKRKKIGVVTTDARLFDLGEDRDQMLITKLEKQYEVVRVDASATIGKDFDCLLCVQPSSLAPDQLKNLIDAIKSGQRAALFEDPLPYIDGSSVSGTKFPRRTPGGPMAMFQGMQQPPPKGNIADLWSLLGVQFDSENVIWQAYNPYPKLEDFPQYSAEWVFVDPAAATAVPEERDVFSATNEISQGLDRLLFLFAGSIKKRGSSQLEYESLVKTVSGAGRTPVDSIVDPNPFSRGGMRENFAESRLVSSPPVRFDLAVRIHGSLGGDAEMADEGAKEAAHGHDAGKGAATAPQKPAEIDVVLVADIDCLYEAFFAIRASGDDPDNEINLHVDNVNFLLNAIDSQAHDDRFIPIRRVGPSYPTLVKFEKLVNEAREVTEASRRAFVKKFDEDVKAEQAALDADVEKLRNDTRMSDQQKQIEVQILQATRTRALAVKREQLNDDKEKNIRQAVRVQEESTRHLQNRFKGLSMLVPPLLPLLLGCVVWVARRQAEREGVGASRLR